VLGAATPSPDRDAPDDDRRLYTEHYLTDTLAVRLGGRAAERLICGEASTGASDDCLRHCPGHPDGPRVRLSDAIGPVNYGGQPGGHPALGAQRGYSEHTQWLLDQKSPPC